MSTSTTSWLWKEYNDFQKQKLNLNLTRGLPSPEQLDLSNELLYVTSSTTREDAECRNYGMLEGIPEARELAAAYLGVAFDEVFVLGNSSLSLMHDIVAQGLLRGFTAHSKRVYRGERIKFLCPTPGYDRHFTICATYGIEMVGIPNHKDSIDIDAIEMLVKEDPMIRGMWYVPKYQNPCGFTCTPEIAKRLATMKTASSEFRIFWDNAYAHHDWGENTVETPPILKLCKDAGNPDRVFLFGSTSKVTFPGSGIAMVASSVTNMEWYRKSLKAQTICPDKLNQRRHCMLFPRMEIIQKHMKLHGEIIQPKFQIAQEILAEELGENSFATWTNPTGGYFMSFDFYKGHGSAKKTVELAKNIGVHITPAGATFPYQFDHPDTNIRLALTYPKVEDVATAVRAFALCAKLSSVTT